MRPKRTQKNIPDTSQQKIGSLYAQLSQNCSYIKFMAKIERKELKFIYKY
jgi:hypothetical protein